MSSEQPLSVVQIEYVNGRCTTDVVLSSPEGLRRSLTHGVEWVALETRDSGELLVRADQVAWIRVRPLDRDESLATWAERQRAFRDADGGGR